MIVSAFVAQPLLACLGNKKNTKNSTKAELVGVDNSLGHIIWAHYFMQEQGYDMEVLLLYQDNVRAMLLRQMEKQAVPIVPHTLR
jgi:hypothetical protein